MDKRGTRDHAGDMNESAGLNTRASRLEAQISISSTMNKMFFASLLAVLLATGSPARSSTTTDFGCGGYRVMASNPDAGVEELRLAMLMDLSSRNFRPVIDAAEEWMTKDCRLTSGEPQLQYWLSGFTALFKRQRDWNASHETIESLQAAYPHHPLARVAEARYWSDYANSARGFGPASTVSPEAWRLFRQRLEKSEEILHKSAIEASKWPLWYLQMIRVQALLGRPMEMRQKIFQEGIRKFPRAWGLYDEMSYYVEPRWGGDWSQVGNIVSLATKNAPAGDADQVYATLYRSRGDLSYNDSGFFAETGASWPRMRNGFTGLLKRFPNSTLLGNAFLSYACLAGDKPTYVDQRKLVPTLDDRAWRNPTRTREACDIVFGYPK